MPPDTHSTDWPAVIAAACAGLSGLITLYFGLRAKARQDDTAAELALIRARAETAAAHAAAAVKTVQDSREERSKQIGEVKEEVGGLRAEVREGIATSNNYNGKIAESTQATQKAAESTQKVAESTQAVAEEVKQIRQELNSQSRHDY